MDVIRQMKIATAGVHSFENAIAIDIDKMNQRVNFEQANLFQDFKEFLMDEYMEPGEFEECWEQFQKWEENEQPTTANNK